jgi:hypothetical protein
VIHSDGWRGYDGLVDVGYDGLVDVGYDGLVDVGYDGLVDVGYDGLVDVGYAKHLRVEHGHNEFGFGTRHPPKGHPTALRAFGALPNDACKSSTACQLTPFIFISKSASGASTTDTIISTCNSSDCSEKTQKIQSDKP